jgi:hypothetical protein
VTISDPATAQITAHKNLGNTRIAYKPRHARARAHTHTPLEARKTQVAISDTATHNPQRGQNANTKHTQTHDGTQALRMRSVFINSNGMNAHRPLQQRDKLHSKCVILEKRRERVIIIRLLILFGCGLDDRGSMVWFLEGAGNLSSHHRVQTGSGTHPASYQMGTRGFFSRGKVAGEWSWPPTSF